jgi:acetyltransferase-like isoleucine patch superfamily enzyme
LRRIKRFLREVIWFIRFCYLRYYIRLDIHKTVRVGRSVTFDRTYPSGIHIGKYTYITNNVTILTHDHASSQWELNTVIGGRCFIGNHTIIMPGLTIGDEVIIGAGSVVTKDVPSNSIAVGNPARIIKRKIRMSEDSRLLPGYEGVAGAGEHD